MTRLLHVTTSDMSLELLLGPQLRAFGEAGFDVHAASADGPFVDRLTADGISHHVLRHATRSSALLEDAAALRELYRLIRRLRPSIVHTHNPKPGVYGRLAARAASTPLVVNTQHGLYAQPGDAWRRRLPVYCLERIAAGASDVELVQNPEDIEVLIRLGVPRRQLWFLGNGVDLERFRPRPELRTEVRRELDLREDDVVVGAVGRLVREKGYRELFEAARLLAGRVDRLRWIVVGPHDLEKADNITAAEVRAAEATGVRFLGHRADPERIYQALDVYALPSYREGWPRAAMEAAACGVPIIASDIRGCRQVVVHGRTGLLVAPRSASGLAAAVRTLCDPALRSRMGRAAAAHAVERFDQRSVVATTLDAYRTLAR